MQLKVLVVEDDENYRFEIKQELEEPMTEQCQFFYATHLQQALDLLEEQSFHLVMADIIFPLRQIDYEEGQVDYKAGLKLIEAFFSKGYDGEFIILSSQEKTFAVDLLTRYRQVIDYLFKDSSWKENRHRFKKHVEALEEKQQFIEKLEQKHTFVGTSVKAEEIRKMALKVKDMDTTVLFTGESGVGKEVAARWFHIRSSRRKRPFVVINCAAVPADLFESILFGHKKGAFTGADADQKGCFEAADGGILFLDEVGELPLGLQAKLLRVLQEKSFVRVGEVHPRQVDVRVFAATNKALEDLVKKRQFREDLYYRINVFPVSIPPLRERVEDIRELAVFFMEDFYRRNGVKRVLIEEAIQALQGWKWPGNIRELKNTVERVAILSDTEEISREIIQRFTGDGIQEFSTLFIPEEVDSYKEAKQMVLDAFHKSFLTRQLNKHGWQISKTADAIGYNRNDLSATIKKLGLEKGNTGW